MTKTNFTFVFVKHIAQLSGPQAKDTAACRRIVPIQLHYESLYPPHEPAPGQRHFERENDNEILDTVTTIGWR